MRYINTNGRVPPEEWLVKARELTDQLKSLQNPEERKALIEGNKALWKELKSWLLEFSHGKCWYSEAKELVSDYHVDHFRPKNRAKQLDGTEREGYWWLAFDWKNYRISGSVCNSPHIGTEGEVHGKSDYFPIKDGSPIADSPDSAIEDEMIYLIDPIDTTDPPLLTFDESGKAKPAADEDTWEYERAKVTIKIMHLDYPSLVDERHKIWNKCIMKINEAQNLMKKEGIIPHSRVKDIFKELREMSSPTAELSSTARACLLSSGIVWARDLVS